MSDEASLWVVVPAGQQASGGWIDDTLKQRALEQGLGAKVPLAAAFPRQRIEVVRGPRAEERLQELYLRRGWSDGLPLVPPTVARVKRALAFTDRPPTDSLGEVEPLKGLATVEKVAANAVMAGCRPEYLPVVLAAVDCLLDPAFNMRGVQTTDENVTPLLIVNGPVARTLDVNGSFGALGPGWQANATIGRALRLVMHNLGGGWPGAVAFAGLGQPGRYTLCLAENEALSPWAPLHVEAGLAADASAVTVTRAETVANVTGGLAEIASIMGTAMSGFGILWNGKPAVLIAPAVAADCARRGMSKDDVRRFLWQHGRWRREQWERAWLTERIVAGRRWPDWVEETAKAGDIPVTRTPDDIVLVVVGGDVPIPQNAYCPSWGFPPARITREVRLPAEWTELLADAWETATALAGGT
ncbi:hypothetical protein [Reyranella sp.]|uniref:hypothetical protein n=1 Tax=Reyranella sp. TaxID=1929291 RepID=UPI0037843AF0